MGVSSSRSPRGPQRTTLQGSPLQNASLRELTRDVLPVLGVSLLGAVNGVRFSMNAEACDPGRGRDQRHAADYFPFCP